MSNMNEDNAEVRARNKELQRSVQRLKDDLVQAQAEIERLGRCNELLDRSHADVVNAQNARIKQLAKENERLEAQLAAIKREWQYGTEVHDTLWRRRMAWLIGEEEVSDE